MNAFHSRAVRSLVELPEGARVREAEVRELRSMQLRGTFLLPGFMREIAVPVPPVTARL